jgi:hypothetical protein
VEGNDKAELFNVCKTRGLKCVYLEDLTIFISGNGYNPDTGKGDPEFAPLKGDSLVLGHLKKYIAPSVKSYEVFPGTK